MSKSQYLILAVIAGVLIAVVVAGLSLMTMPWLFERELPQILADTPSPVAIFPSQTPILIPTEATNPTETPTVTVLTTATTVPTATGTPSPTPIPIPCDWAEFVKDVTTKDGSLFAPGVSFTKIWRLRNIGSCTWNSDYALVFSSGNAMDAPLSFPLPGPVPPGETVDLTIMMQAPDDEGTYTGYWQLRNATGSRFGIGDDRTGAFWVRITVDLPCYWAGFIKDVTIPDNTSFTPDAVFIKTWRLKNIGDCNWTTAFDLIHIRGDKLNATVVDMPKRVEPGETVDISVRMQAPDKPGDYRGYWKIKAADGTEFGLGDSQDSPFWVDIRVLVAENDYIFDFAANLCSAVWNSGLGSLPCPGLAQTNGGFVLRLDEPHLENRSENEPALWTAPDADQDGWISGKFPAVVVQEGYRFKAWVGCLAGAEECEVTFYLRYQLHNEEFKTLGSWDEIYDGKVTMIDLDLSALAGKEVFFILVAEVDGGDPKDADAFWFSPRIEIP